jgi:hypothetical protein
MTKPNLMAVQNDLTELALFTPLLVPVKDGVLLWAKQDSSNGVSMAMMASHLLSAVSAGTSSLNKQPTPFKA